MALIKGSALVDAISGSVGGTTFATTKFGGIARSRPRMVRHTSPRALRASAAVQQVMQEWIDLAPLEQAAWNTAAASTPFTNRLGISRPMSGMHLALWTNVPAAYENEPILWNAPRGSITPTPGPPTIHFRVGGPYGILLDECVPNFGQCQVMASRPVRTSTTNTFRNWKSLGIYLMNQAAALDCQPEFDAAFGPLTLGEIVGIRLRASSGSFSGESKPTFFQTTVTAP